MPWYGSQGDVVWGGRGCSACGGPWPPRHALVAELATVLGALVPSSAVATKREKMALLAGDGVTWVSLRLQFS
eukprot:CAMPEP_0170441352 /NCGR_PEP_ID=MMETSP0117_2-20130122/46849_1 /TAXON_ID=400756 /ORGANISM="Durinskia baltica, Strain CSIRO CS-38" /LENGTH=72 /DNA_ID=CAMNT_0010701889 /DNA_START=79 /DNA_END=297 /DNA_ORIENTATION=-